MNITEKQQIKIQTTLPRCLNTPESWVLKSKEKKKRRKTLKVTLPWVFRVIHIMVRSKGKTIVGDNDGRDFSGTIQIFSYLTEPSLHHGLFRVEVDYVLNRRNNIVCPLNSRTSLVSEIRLSFTCPIQQKLLNLMIKMQFQNIIFSS